MLTSTMKYYLKESLIAAYREKSLKRMIFNFQGFGDKTVFFDKKDFSGAASKDWCRIFYWTRDVEYWSILLQEKNVGMVQNWTSKPTKALLLTLKLTTLELEWLYQESFIYGSIQSTLLQNRHYHKALDSCKPENIAYQSWFEPWSRICQHAKEDPRRRLHGFAYHPYYRVLTTAMAPHLNQWRSPARKRQRQPANSLVAHI